MPNPNFEPNNRRTAVVASGQTVIEGRLVSIAAAQQVGVTGSKLPVVQHTAAGARSWAYAETGGAAGERVTLLRGASVFIPAAANITAGQEVEVGTAGQVIPLNTGKAVGQAEDTTASGADCPVTLY